MLDALRVKHAPEMKRKVIGVEPSGAREGQDSSHDEQGIVVGGVGVDDHGYVLEDASCQLSPHGWGRRVVEKYVQWDADCIVAEENFGGAMVEETIQTAADDMGVHIRYKPIKVSRGKVVRAEPLAALYEQRRVHHVGVFGMLEDQMCCFTQQGYVGGRSPDRADAGVFAMSELMLGVGAPTYRGTETIAPARRTNSGRPVEPMFRRR
jgi:phage terminase large subunit-like protein